LVKKKGGGGWIEGGDKTQGGNPFLKTPLEPQKKTGNCSFPRKRGGFPGKFAKKGPPGEQNFHFKSPNPGGTGHGRKKTTKHPDIGFPGSAGEGVFSAGQANSKGPIFKARPKKGGPGCFPAGSGAGKNKKPPPFVYKGETEPWAEASEGTTVFYEI